MTTANRKRIFGDKIAFKSLSCAPVNELGVVYLFGVLHDTFDFKIESIQSGYPDCLARRKVGNNRWEEVRIEFEYDSRSFTRHTATIHPELMSSFAGHTIGRSARKALRLSNCHRF